MDRHQADAAEQAARRRRVNDRRVLNGIFWILRLGAPWRDLPENYGPRTTCYNRVVRWRRAGVWDRIMDALAADCDAAELHRLTVKRAALLPVLHDADAVGASVRDFCERARARLENCHDFESKRQFLADCVARVVYTRYKVTVRGSVPIMRNVGGGQDQSSAADTLEFRIEGEINGAMLHGRRSMKFPNDDRVREWELGGRLNQPARIA